MTTAELLTIGTELLLGQTVDTNSAYMAEQLGREGIDVFRCVTVGDNRRRIAAAVKDAMGRADAVITTGGLGPTVDDVTRGAVADAFGVELRFDDGLWSQVQDRFRAFGVTPPDNNRRQAYVPAGAEVIDNPVGTAPGFHLGDGPVVYCLPGVPREMRHLLARGVLPHLRRAFPPADVLLIRVLHTAGAGESRVDQRLADLEAAANPTVGLAARAGVVDVRLAAKAATEMAAKELLAPVEAEVRRRLGEWVFGADGDTLAQACLRSLAARGWRLAAAEGGVAGALAGRLGRAAPGPTEASRGPVTAPPLAAVEVLPAGARSDATSLAEEVRNRWGAEAGLAAILSSAGGQGRVEVAMVTPESTETAQRRLGGPPGQGPSWAANLALDLLRRGVGRRIAGTAHDA